MPLQYMNKNGQILVLCWAGMFAVTQTLTFLIFVFIRFGAVACGVASELYVFGGVRSRDDNQSSEMVTCKSEFYHDEFKR